MPRYSYTARTADGEETSSTATVSNLSVLASRLESEGLTLRSAQEVKENLPRVRGIPYFEVIGIYRQIASAIEAGLPVAETLEMLSGEARNMRLKSLLYFLKSQVSQGVPLSEAMKHFPAIFPAVHIAVVKSGEESGQLGKALDDLADQAEAFSNMNRRFASALVYPTVVSIAALTLMIYGFAVIAPRFRELYIDLGVTRFSSFTQMVLFVSRLVLPVTIFLIAAAVILVVLILSQRRASSGRLWIDLWKLRIPIVGQIIEKGVFARFSSMLGLLLDSGIDLPRAVRLASEGAGNRTVEHLLRNLSAQVELGNTLSEAMDRTGVMPSTLAWRVGVGEETGTLPDALTRMSRLYARQVDSLVTSLAGVLEPTLIIILGAGVAMLVIGLLMPLAAIIQSLTSYSG